MKGFAARKVPGGKLVKAQVEYGYILENVKITGDFFLHPEESISDIENAALSCHHSDSENVFKDKILEVVKRKKIQMIGVTADDFAQVIKEAIRGMENSPS